MKNLFNNKINKRAECGRVLHVTIYILHRHLQRKHITIFFFNISIRHGYSRHEELLE